MKYESIAEIYDGNERIRARLKDVVSRLTHEQLTAVPDGEKWNIQQIVEHISIVDESTIKICAKLLKKAQEAGVTSDGSVAISDGFVRRGQEISGIKVEAPSFVQPTGQRSISESLERLDQNADRLVELRPLFETVGCTGFTFPHPFFGEITAHEWLALKGGHEMRHIRQIEKLAKKVL